MQSDKIKLYSLTTMYSNSNSAPYLYSDVVCKLELNFVNYKFNELNNEHKGRK